MMRAGKPTSSAFDNIITPAKLELSKSRFKYMNALLAEWIQGCPIETPATAFMKDGTDREDQTVAAYEMVQDCEVEPCGFFTTDDGMIGASPDRIVRSKNRGIEAKSPQLPAHVGYMMGLGVDAEYRVQLLGQLWVCEFEQVDIVSWNPLVPASALVVVPIQRREEDIDKVAKAVTDFRDELMEAQTLITQRYGIIPKPIGATTLDEEDGLGVTDEDVEAILEHARSINGQGN